MAKFIIEAVDLGTIGALYQAGSTKVKSVTVERKE